MVGLRLRSEEDVRESLAGLRALDRGRVSDAELMQLLRAAFEGYAWSTKRLVMKEAYRARRLSGGIENVRVLWYPPRECVTRIGRANRVGESVLYVADGEGTAIFEVQPRVGDLVWVVRAIPREGVVPPTVFEIGVVEKARMGDGSPAARRPNLSQVLGGEDNVRKNELLREFLVQEFTRLVRPGSEQDYRLSLAIAEFHRDGRVAGLWYPSIASGRGSTNAALRPEEADRYLRPQECWQVRIEEELDDRQFRVRRVIQSESIDESGTIRWR